MLVAAGFEPVFQQRDLQHPALAAVCRDIEMILAGHDPNPAMAVDRHWMMLSANKAVANLVAGAEPMLLRPPVNLLRLCLHPAGLASRIVNLTEWRAHVIARLRRQIDATGDSGLTDLLEEIRDYPAPSCAGPSGARPFGSRLFDPRPSDRRQTDADGLHGIAIPFQLVTIDGTLSFFSTTTLFGSPADITLSELIIEALLPADQQTSDILRRHAQRSLTQEPCLPLMESRSPADHPLENGPLEDRPAENRRVATPA